MENTTREENQGAYCLYVATRAGHEEQLGPEALDIRLDKCMHAQNKADIWDSDLEERK